MQRRKKSKRLIVNKRERTCHPDKVSEKREQFDALQEAYETLRDVEKRSKYDAGHLHQGDNYLRRFKEQNVQYFLDNVSENHTLYEYYNHFFGLSGDERIGPGQPLEVNYLWEKIDYVRDILQREINRLNHSVMRFSDLSQEAQERVGFLSRRTTKIGQIQLVLFSSCPRRKLYDAALGIYHNSELSDITLAVGGQSVLAEAIRQEDPRIHFCSSVYALHACNCLNPSNFKKFTRYKGALGASVSYAMKHIQKVGLLNQPNFDLLMRHMTHPHEISCGISYLEAFGILEQKYFECVLRSGKKAKTVGTGLRLLKEFGILNDENWQIVIRIPGVILLSHLNEMEKDKILIPEKTAALLWHGPKELEGLHHRLNQMFAHGLFLLSCAPEKGKVAMVLALELKNDLKGYMELPKLEQIAQKERFKHNFLTKLHSQDNIMSEHRAFWKVIVANILIAFTGLGLLSIGATYLLTGHCLFAKTKSEENIAAIEKTMSSFEG